MPTYTFNEKEARAAYDEWGCNCGPAALAFALQVGLDAVRHAIPHFAERRYTSPAMMAAALDFLGHKVGRLACSSRTPRDSWVRLMFAGPMSLVRIQFTGPWIVNGRCERWAARKTHWIAAWSERGVALVFDINCGIDGFPRWEDETLPRLIAACSGADGGWYPTNIWRPRPALPEDPRK